MRGDDGGLFAGMRRGRGDDGAQPMSAFAALQRRFVDRRRRHVELEIAGADVRAARRVARNAPHRRPTAQAQIETRQQRRDHARHQPPAAERTLRQAAVDHDHRNFALGARQDEIGPQIGFDEQRQVGPPMVEEAPHEARRVERNELVQGAVRQPLLGERRRRDRARRDQHGEILRAHPLDQRHHGEHFADAGAVHPDQRALRTRQARLAAALGQALGMFLAARQTPRQHLRRDRRSGGGRQLIKSQRKRQATATLNLRRAVDRPARRRAASPH